MQRQYTYEQMERAEDEFTMVNCGILLCEIIVIFLNVDQTKIGKARYFKHSRAINK